VSQASLSFAPSHILCQKVADCKSATMFRAAVFSVTVGCAQASPYYPTTFSVANTGFCLDVPDGDTSNGNGLWLWECLDNKYEVPANQQFLLAYENGIFEPPAYIRNSCIDAGSMQDGFNVWLWDCQNPQSPQQIWKKWDDGSGLIHLGMNNQDDDLCLSVADTPANGVPVVLAPCDQAVGWDKKIHVPCPCVKCWCPGVLSGGHPGQGNQSDLHHHSSSAVVV